MALRIACSHSSWSAPHSITSPERTLSYGVSSVSSSRRYNGVTAIGDRIPTTSRRKSVVRARLDAVAGDALVGTVTEVNQDSFWPIVNGAGDKPVVLDMYTQWCGPCKIIAPKFEELSEKYMDCIFLKLDCNQENKSLAKELGLKVVPTFKILKDSKIVKEVRGAKLDDLVAALETIRST